VRIARAAALFALSVSIAIFAAFGLLLYFAESAHAGAKIDRALAIAQAVWHPACGQLSVAYGDPADVGAPDGAFEWAWKDDCVIGVTNKAHLEFEQLCQVILHGGGHVAGLGHSDNQRSVMRPEFFSIETTMVKNGRTTTHWDGIDRRCLGRR
jgi:hypothetical protein